MGKWNNMIGLKDAKVVTSSDSHTMTRVTDYYYKINMVWKGKSFTPTVKVIQQPNAGNGFTAKIQTYNPSTYPKHLGFEYSVTACETE
jgi:hypothetical protein